MVTCKCGKRFSKVCEFINVKQIGFALFGDCSKCGQQHDIGFLWRLKRVVTIQSSKIAGKYPKTLDLSKLRL